MLRSQFVQRHAGNLVRAFAGVLLVVLAFLAPQAQPQTTEALGQIQTQQNISNTSDMSELPAISYAVGRLAVVWGERNSADIDLNTTTLGSPFPRPQPFNTGSMTAYQNADVVVDNAGAAHFIFASGNRIYHRARTAAGVLTPPHSIASASFPNPLRLALAPNGTLWAIWRDADGTGIFYRFSRDAGLTWSNGSDGGVAASESGNMFSPDIAVDRDSNPHIVWYLRTSGGNKGNIRFADWTGARFTKASLTTDGAALYDADPSIVVDGQNVQHEVWRKQAGSNWVMFYAYRTPGGTWQGYTPIKRTNGDAKYPPAIGTDSRGDVYITYSDPMPGNTRRITFFSKSVGKGWEGPVALSRGRWDSRSAIAGSISSLGVVANVVHQHESGTDDGDIIYSRIVTQSCSAQALADYEANEQVGDPSNAQVGGDSAAATAGRKLYFPIVGKARPTPTPQPGC
jgi:hypothetical protein